MTDSDSINDIDFTNLLESGAFLRHQGVCYLALLGSRRNVTDVRTLDSRLKGLLISDFFSENQQFIKFLKVTEWTSESLQKRLEKFIHEHVNQHDLAVKKILFKEPLFLDFQADFDKIQHEFSTGKLDKAVPVVFERSDYKVNAVDRARWLLSLLNAPEALWVHGFWNSQEGLLGATPEALFYLRDQKISTMALAGTKPRFQPNGAENVDAVLMSDDKELSEHQFVVGDIVHELQEFGTVQKSEPFVQRLPTLLHLKTLIEVTLSQKLNYRDLTQKLHPTPALGVAPRKFDFRWLNNLKGSRERKYYGAPWVWKFSEDHVLGLVAIRNIQWNEGEVLLGSGCGVVKGSQIDSEWSELKNKRNSVKKLLGIL